MKRIAAIFITLVGFGFAASPSHALFSISADVPLSFTIDGDAADSVSGFLVGVSLPFFVGFGFENYEATFKGAAGGTDVVLSNKIFDVFVDLPVPFVNIGIGLGAGTVAIDTGSVDIWDDASLTQFFVTVGIPIVILFDVHVGYHVLSGTASAKSGTGAADLEIDAVMISLGAKVGF